MAAFDRGLEAGLGAVPSVAAGLAGGAGFTIEHLVGDPAALLGRPHAGRRAVALCQPTAPALVLGSSQDERLFDPRRIAAWNLGVARRRSGGGAVLLCPGELCWIDLDLPAGDPLVDRDVVRAFVWLGRVWSRALAHLGVVGATVQGTEPSFGPFGRLVCFAGVGPGEVSVRGRKVVGLSQRRDRAGVRFACAALLSASRWGPGGQGLAAELLAAPSARAGVRAALFRSTGALGELGATQASPETVLEGLVSALAHEPA